jgi:hypothetical protein
MAGVDPVSGGATNATFAAAVDAELAALAADAKALEAMLSAGDIIQAKVLPSNGLTDLIQILGNRVAAALPPNLVPGDVITVQVTSIADGHINVQILPDAPAATDVPLPPGAAPSPPAPVIANGTTVPLPIPPLTTSTAPSPIPSPPATGALPVAPPVSVFVAAAIRPAQTAPAFAAAPIEVESVAPTPPPVAPGTPETPVQNAPAASVISTPASARAPALGVPILRNIEAMLATARAAVLPKGTPPPPASSTPAAPAPSAASPKVAPSQPQAATPIINRPFFAPPIVTSARVPAAALPVAPATPAANAPTPTTRLITVYQDPATLLRALRLPVTPTNIASARIAIDTPARLPDVLSTLQRALPSSSDPRITTLRTLIAFVSAIKPDSPVLSSQIAAFVDHVVTGSEPKLAQLLFALSTLADEEAPAPQTPTPATGTPTPGASTNAPVAPNAPQPAPVTTDVTNLARVAERQTAVDFDMKTQLLSMIAAPPAGATEALTSAVGNVLTAMTALQVNAASVLAANPNGFSFAIPMMLPTGYAQANVRVDRDTPENARAPLDGDNFHIAFILETAHLGTVAIDLKTVGRAVTIDVKAEATLAARAFGKAMEQLTTRLEKLRYRVASANASVAARGMTGVVSTTIGPEPAPAAPVDPTKLVDRSA